MLRSIRKFLGYSVLAEDGESGIVYDLYFDDQIWLVRYVVIEIGEGGRSRRVVVPTTAFRKPDEEKRLLPVRLSRVEVEYSPGLEAGQKASRLGLSQLSAQIYMDRLGGRFDERTLGMGPDSILEMLRINEFERPVGLELKEGSLQSARQVTEYQFQAQDGQIGYIKDFLVNDETWGIYYLVIDTGYWWAGHNVLISPFSVSEISRRKGRVLVNLDWEVIQNGPHYECSEQLGQEYLEKPYEHYARPKPGRSPVLLG